MTGAVSDLGGPAPLKATGVGKRSTALAWAHGLTGTGRLRPQDGRLHALLTQPLHATVLLWHPKNSLKQCQKQWGSGKACLGCSQTSLSQRHLLVLLMYPTLSSTTSPALLSSVSFQGAGILRGAQKSKVMVNNNPLPARSSRIDQYTNITNIISI